MTKKAVNTDFSGVQKAAVLMLALDEEQSARLFGMMQEDEIREVSAAMSQLGQIKADAVERLCIEFGSSMGGSGQVVGSYESTERLLQRALPRERAAQIMDEIRGPAGLTMWDKLGNVSDAVLANYLKNEYPQTVAVILSKLQPENAARVLALLPNGFAIEVVMRMLRMDSVHKEVLTDIETTLRAEFMSTLSRSSKRNPHEMMAEIFSNLDRGAEAKFVAALEERSRDSADQIKALMFTFEDLGKLSSAAVQILLRETSKDKLPVALKGASDGLRQLFFGSMSERAGKMLRDDIEGLGPVKLRDVDEAQTALVVLAKDLAANGMIEISSGKEEEVVQ